MDLRVERSKLETLVESLRVASRALDQDPLPPLWVDAVALRLQSFYTGIERCFVLIVRAINGAPPDGADWHRRLLDRMTVASPARPAVLRADTAQSLGELLRFRHVVRHLYAYELEAEPVERLLGKVLGLWPEVSSDLDQFTAWLLELLEAL
ncbi:MAG: hypothetical protein FJ082_13910 [Cyanobacteria bacterium K_Offshore_surface_m2_011]|nr:hypothetical protein [Cyanobacteria bacterium K_Offshore_surface_m2_011]